MESWSIPTRLVGCTLSEPSIELDEPIELSEGGQAEQDQVVLDVDKKNQKGKKRGGVAKMRRLPHPNRIW